MSVRTLEETSLAQLLAGYPAIAEFILSVGGGFKASLGDWLSGLTDEEISDAGMEPAQMLAHIRRIVEDSGHRAAPESEGAHSLDILGGYDKSGRKEEISLTVNAGEVVCIVGPTGSGKSQLLADIECLARGDTPTGRRILIDHKPPAASERRAADRKLVAQLSQNMNFVIDLSVTEFIAMHARCGGHEGADAVASVIACANALTGEKFAADQSLTQLSGGQTRALMIADVALLSRAPVVLIDEIENAGVDRRRALDLLMSKEKIVLISTHDPLLALRGDRRLVIKNGGIAEILATSDAERRALARLEDLDLVVSNIRDRLRNGLRIEEEAAL